MAGLKLKLKASERVIINGCIVQNGPHQAELIIETPNTKILRLRDAIHPEEANTPVKRVCYVAQMEVAGEVETEQAYNEFTQGTHALLNVFQDEGSQATMLSALEFAEKRNFYKAMQLMRKLIPYEEALLFKYNLSPVKSHDTDQETVQETVTLKDLHNKLIEHSKTE